MSIFLFSFVCHLSVKSLAVKTASKMTYTVSGGALNSTHSLTHLLNSRDNSSVLTKILLYAAADI